MSGRTFIAAVLLAAAGALGGDASDAGAGAPLGCDSHPEYRSPEERAHSVQPGRSRGPLDRLGANGGHESGPEHCLGRSPPGPSTSLGTNERVGTQEQLRPPPLASPAPTLRRNPLARQADEARVQRVLATLDLRARVGQLLLAYPQVRAAAPVEVGGVLYVGNTLQNLARAKERIAVAVAHARVPPFVAVDMEGGPFNRMRRARGLEALPAAREMAQLDDAEVRAWGRKVGEAMRGLGLNMNLAPVLDVAATGHMARNQRSYSGDPLVVAAKARAYAEGLLSAGVVPIGKHYPGYGDLEEDSDHGLARADWPKEKVLAQRQVFEELAPALAGVMLSNLVYSAYGPKPAILSPPLVAMAHQREWLAVTDDVAIGALADAVDGSAADVLRAALMAGNDVLLTTAPPDWDAGLDYLAVLTAYAEESPAARLQVDASCRRVLRLKERMGLLDGR